MTLDQRDDVRVIDVLLLVTERDELLEDMLEHRCFQFKTQRLNSVTEGMSAAVLAQDQIRSDIADVFWPHDLVSRSILEHPVLMNARLVSERVLADDGLVTLHGHARDAADQTADREQL